MPWDVERGICCCLPKMKDIFQDTLLNTESSEWCSTWYCYQRKVMCDKKEPKHTVLRVKQYLFAVFSFALIRAAFQLPPLFHITHSAQIRVFLGSSDLLPSSFCPGGFWSREGGLGNAHRPWQPASPDTLNLLVHHCPAAEPQTTLCQLGGRGNQPRPFVPPAYGPLWT